MSQTSRILASIVMGSIVLGIILMAVAVSVLQDAFGIGLGLFCLGIGISAIWGVWNTAGWAERKIR